jgi:hypothetical protein
VAALPNGRRLWKGHPAGDYGSLTFKTACDSVGVHYTTFNDWHKQDSRFALAIEQAEARRIQKLLSNIEAAGHTDWKAWAWLLERRHPDLFARPDIQLHQHYVTGRTQIEIENLQAGVTASHPGFSKEPRLQSRFSPFWSDPCRSPT